MLLLGDVDLIYVFETGKEGRRKSQRKGQRHLQRATAVPGGPEASVGEWVLLHILIYWTDLCTPHHWFQQASAKTNQ